MSNTNRLTGRNALIAAMFEDCAQLKHYYRFTALNPHINLHDACNILLARPNATICFPYEEWNELGRQVKRGKQSIAYYDYDGYKQYVFDVSDTRGDNQYHYSVIPIDDMLIGFAELNGVEITKVEDSDFTKILNGTKFYLHEQGIYSGDEQRDNLLAEGIAYSLYAKTGLPENEQIRLQGLPFNYQENADFVKEVYVQAEMLAQELEDAHRNKQEEIIVIDDTEEETVSDEPINNDNKHFVQFDEVIKARHNGYYILTQYQYEGEEYTGLKLYLGKTSNYDEENSRYDNSDNSLVFLSEKPDFEFLFTEIGFYATQQELIDRGVYTAEDYKKYAELQNGILSGIEVESELLFGVNDNIPNSGVPFRYPNWQDEQAEEQVEPKHPAYPMYKRYMELQKGKPNAIVLYRLGDFYEAFEESARQLSSELDLTLTGRDVGLKERIPMCGIPYHAMDEYLNKILKNHGVLLVDGDDEPMYVFSHAEALEQSATKEEKQSKPVLTEMNDDEPTPFDDEQSETDEEWRNELAEELGDLADEQSDENTEGENFNEDEELAETDSSSDEQKEDDNSEQKIKPKVKDKKESTQKKPEKGIKDRKRKEKPQPTLFDYLTAPQEKTPEEALIERQLKYGSGVEHGKFRIFDKYQENPSIKTFADFLKNEYGWGGHGGWAAMMKCTTAKESLCPCAE